MSPTRFGRFIGATYALYFLTAITGTMLAMKAPDSIDHTVGITLAVASTAVYAFLAFLFYRLFAHGNRAVSLGALSFALAGCIVQGWGIIAALRGLQVSALGFFAVFCLLLGYLILTTRLTPALFGWLMLVAGLGWLAFLIPGVASHGGAVLEVIGFLAELALMLRLLFFGVSARA